MICDRLSHDNLSLISDSHDGAQTAQQDNLQLGAQSVLPLGWPFFIICLIHTVTALGYLALSNYSLISNFFLNIFFVSVGLPIPMPTFYDSIREGFVLKNTKFLSYKSDQCLFFK